MRFLEIVHNVKVWFAENDFEEPKKIVISVPNDRILHHVFSQLRHELDAYVMAGHRQPEITRRGPRYQFELELRGIKISFVSHALHYWPQRSSYVSSIDDAILGRLWDRDVMTDYGQSG